MKSIDQFNFKGKRVLMRVDFNVPLNDDFSIRDDKRMRAALPSIRKVLNDGGSLVIMSHLGRPKNGPEEKFSLKHIVEHLSAITKAKVFFAADCISEEAMALAETLNPGQILLLENVRFYAEETKGDTEFAEKLSRMGDFYLNDAFGTAHRAHASTAIVASHFKGARAAGFLMKAELDNAAKVIKMPSRPFVAIMGGAKVSDKIQIIENLLEVVDELIIGGGMVYTFFKAKGAEIGNSLCEEDKLDLALALIKKAEEKGVNLHLPQDSVIADDFAADAMTAVADNYDIPEGWMGLDIGPESIKTFSEVLSKASTVLWNGPCGVFEMAAFEKGTKAVAEKLAEITKAGAYSLIGGGDSAAAVKKFDLEDQMSFVSTGGGALLEYMEGKTLPGVAALEA